MITWIQTTEKTFNKKVKAQLVELMPSTKKFTKKHVPGVGYVFYIKNDNNETIGQVFKEFGVGMKIYIK